MLSSAGRLSIIIIFYNFFYKSPPMIASEDKIYFKIIIKYSDGNILLIFIQLSPYKSPPKFVKKSELPKHKIGGDLGQKK
jgi:hypothetical protein